MINLRFHIVSIVAVFLALAVGIVTGSTLLDRVTVQQLEATQTQIERKIEQKSAQNDALRKQLDALDVQTGAFSESVLDSLVSNLIRGTPVVLIAARGVDENVVRDVERDLGASGATTYGVLWIDQRLDLSRSETIASLAKLYAIDTGSIDQSTAASLRQRFLDDFAAELAASARPGTGVTPTSGPAPTGLIARLAADGLIDWDAPSAPQITPRTLPAADAELVMIAGEGATVAVDTTLEPVVEALARTAGGRVVAAELMNRRSSADAADRVLDPRRPQRGGFVDPLRRNEQIAAATVTIDSLDHPFGRLALVLVVADRVQNGRFGTLPSAESVFPPSA